jgi:hypothetical protein
MSKNIKDVEKFTINRTTWLRGEQGTLLNAEKKMCCLGFYSLACGLKPKHIDDHGSPQEVIQYNELIEWESFLLNNDNMDTITCEKLINVNDDPHLNDKEREKSLKKIFKSNGVKVKFVGKSSGKKV